VSASIGSIGPGRAAPPLATLSDVSPSAPPRLAFDLRPGSGAGVDALWSAGLVLAAVSPHGFDLLAVLAGAWAILSLPSWPTVRARAARSAAVGLLVGSLAITAIRGAAEWPWLRVDAVALGVGVGVLLRSAALPRSAVDAVRRPSGQLVAVAVLVGVVAAAVAEPVSTGTDPYVWSLAILFVALSTDDVLLAVLVEPRTGCGRLFTAAPFRWLATRTWSYLSCAAPAAVLAGGWRWGGVALTAVVGELWLHAVEAPLRTRWAEHRRAHAGTTPPPPPPGTMRGARTPAPAARQPGHRGSPPATP
jgi:hypothetical protein